MSKYTTTKVHSINCSPPMHARISRRIPYGGLQILKANQPFPEVKGEETFLSPDERVFRVHKLVCGGEELLEAATQPSLLSLIKEIRAIVCMYAREFSNKLPSNQRMERVCQGSLRTHTNA